MSKLNDEMNKTREILEIIIHEYTQTYYKVYMLHESIKAYNFISQNNTEIYMSVRLLQDTLYSSAIVDLNTLFMDKSDDTISLKYIISKLQREDFKAHIIKNYAKIPATRPIDKHNLSDFWHEDYIKSKTIECEERLQKLTSNFDELQKSPLYDRINKIRNKRIAHRNTKNYNITEKEHRIDEAEELLVLFKEILFEVNHILFKKTYLLDDLEIKVKQASEQFWGKFKG